MTWAARAARPCHTFELPFPTERGPNFDKPCFINRIDFAAILSSSNFRNDMASGDSPTLVVRDATGEMMRVPFAAGKLLIGRVSQSDVKLEHGLVSRQHAEIWRDAEDRYHVRDLRSSNGTLVNGRAISDAILDPNDEIGIGPFVLTIEQAGAAPKKKKTTSARIVLADEGATLLSLLRDYAPPRIDVAHLTTLNDFSRKLFETPEAAARSAALCGLMVGPQFRGLWAAIVQTPRGSEERPPEVLFEESGAMIGHEPYLSRSVLRRVRETGEAVLASNVGLPAQQNEDANANVKVSVSPDILAMAAVACPIATAAEVIDVLYVMLPPALGSVEWLALVSLAVKQYQQARSVWAARAQAETFAAMQQELARARHIQMRLLPRNPKFDRLDVAIGFVPCDWVGGDYADAVRMKDGRMLLAIADVCGNGLSAALVASSVHTMIHAGARGGASLAELMNSLNDYLNETLAGESYVTMIAVAVDPASGELEMANAGHPPALVMSPGQEPRRIDVAGNLPLGMDSLPIATYRLALAPDELLSLYSDGLSELGIGEEQLLEIEGICGELKTIYTAGQITVQAAAEHLSRRLDALQGSRPPVDDRTFLLARLQ
jgi:serine phosphatase RsbU (regulator of sigma subunit)